MPRDTTMNPVVIRAAGPEDAPHFVRIFDRASNGLAPYFWAEAAKPGQTATEVGLARIHEKLRGAPAGTCFVAEVAGQVAGGIFSYDIGADPVEIEPGTHPVVVPLIELENEALQTRYINAIAVFDGFQGKGVATMLLGQVARYAGANGMSLIVEDGNDRARQLYRRLGYVDITSRAIVKSGWMCDSTRDILMVKPRH